MVVVCASRYLVLEFKRDLPKRQGEGFVRGCLMNWRTLPAARQSLPSGDAKSPRARPAVAAASDHGDIEDHQAPQEHSPKILYTPHGCIQG